MKSQFNKIYLGNSPKVLKKFTSDTFDLTVTSPPYDGLRTYGHLTGNFVFHELIDGLFRITKPGGVVVWVVGDEVKYGTESGSSFSQALYFMKSGFLLHDTMIFEKNTSSFPARKSGNRYTQIFEYMFVFSKGKPKTANLICDKENKWAGYQNWGRQTKRLKDGTLNTVADITPVAKFSPRNNIWKYTVSGFIGNKDKDAYKHPATFPEKLAQDHILTWSNPGDLILDPMCGSGTTCLAAKKLKRRFVGIDISKEYVALARRRLGN